MSNKYVPSFLKDKQTATPATTTQSTPTSVWPGQKSTPPTLNTTNKFGALSDDFPMNKRDKPVVNTSLPAKEAPKLAPATLASLTGNGKAVVVTAGAGGSGPKKSFAAKFAEQVKITSDPDYVPPPKPVDLNSEEDFPSLGAPKKPATTSAWGAKPVKNEIAESGGPSFAEKAREWANKKAEEEEKARKKALRDERLRREAELIKTIPMIGLRRHQNYYNDDDEEDEYNRPYDESSLGDSDSFEITENDQEPSDNDEEGEEDSEFNQNVGWDGRRRGDLY
jgi:hypothetical protein